MIDIHAHVIPFVDDGAKNLNEALALLKSEVESGVTDIICTPHLRKQFNKTGAEIKNYFLDFKKEVLKAEIPVNLYLGREIFVDKKLYENIKVKDNLMNGKEFALIEFDFNISREIAEICYSLTVEGVTPIVAHLERYSYAKLEDAEEIKSAGGLIQVNASSFVGEMKKYYKKKVVKMFKEGLIDFVASDIHYGRNNVNEKAFSFVSKKFGVNVAEDVFINNAKKYLI